MPLQRKLCWDGVDVWVWKITETTDELSQLVPEGLACYAREKFASEKRRAEWLAVRVIMAQLFGDSAHIVYDVAGKPSIEGVSGYISVSHTKGYAANPPTFQKK
jgi:phosphopantetheinyl transferase